MPVNVSCDLFDKCITPILNYGCEVWGFHTANEVEKLHLWFCKLILNVKSSTLNEMVYGELSRVPMFVKRNIVIIKYWIKLVNNTENKLSKTMYLGMVRECDLENAPNWCNYVKTLLFQYGFGNIWTNQDVDKSFISNFKQRCLDIYQQNFNSKLEESSKARLYCDSPGLSATPR